MMEERQIDFAWTIVDWRTFDPASPLITFPGDAISKAPSALEVLPCREWRCGLFAKGLSLRLINLAAAGYELEEFAKLRGALCVLLRPGLPRSTTGCACSPI